MNIIEAIADPNLFRGYLADDDQPLDTWSRWLSFLRVLHGLPLDEQDRETAGRCTGRDPAALPPAGFDEALLLCGRRSGKSKIIALCAAYEAVLSGRESRLSPGEIGMVAVVSPTRFQSRIVHSYIRSIFDAPLLSGEVAEEKKEGFVLTSGVEIAILTGDHRSIRGFTLLSAVVDEASMFGLSEESKVRSDSELVRALRPALGTTGGRLLAIATPYRPSGYCYETFRRAFSNDAADVLCWCGASLTMNPTLPPAVVERAMQEDPAAAACEYAVEPGVWRDDIESFVPRSLVESLVVRGRTELPPRSGVGYAAFADMSGGRSDDAALAVAHKEGQTVILDCLERFPAPHNPHEVVGRMALILRRYGLDRCVGDAYSAEWSRSAFKEHGIDYRRATTSVWKEGVSAKNRVAKPKSILYAELLPRLTSGSVELLDNEVLIVQLSSLQRRTRSGGRDSIDHPPGGHDDSANVLAGVCDAVQQRRIVAGITFGNMLAHQSDPKEGAREPDWMTDFRRRAEQYEKEMQELAAMPDDSHIPPLGRTRVFQ